MLSNNNQYKLLLDDSYTYDIRINWGDNTPEEIFQGTPTGTPPGILHTYAVPGTYDVSIKENSPGGFPKWGMSFPDDFDQLKVVAVKQWGDNKWADLSNNFIYHLNLNYLAEPNPEYNILENLDPNFGFRGVFQWCYSLSAFPYIGDTSNIQSFRSTWNGCTGLKTFPVLNFNNATDIGSAWNRCHSLEYFPNVAFPVCTDFSSTWRDCRSLKSFDITEFSLARRTTGLVSTWNGCASLTSFPIISLPTGSDLRLNFTWSGCSSLTHFPALNINNATRLDSTWRNCTSLRTFDITNIAGVTTTLFNTWENTGFIDFPNVNFPVTKGFWFTWSSCSQLTGFHTIDFPEGNSFTGTWSQCTSLTTFPQISAPKAFAFSNCWERCTSLQKFPRIHTVGGNLFAAWRDCASLTEFTMPHLLPSNAPSNFKEAWKGCTSLTQFNFTQWSFAGIGNGINDCSGMFTDVTLPTNTWSSILTSICSWQNPATPNNPSVIIDGGFSKRNAAGTLAYNYLVSKQWTINDGGPE